MRNSTLILTAFLLGALVPLAAKADDSYWPFEPFGVTEGKPVTEANKQWQDRAFDEQGDRGGCNADFVPTWAMSSRNLYGCYANPFGKATEGGSN